MFVKSVGLFNRVKRVLKVLQIYITNSMVFADNGEFNQSFSEQCWDIYKGSLYTRVKDRLTWFLNIVQ